MNPTPWSVREDGNKVIIEFECQDHYAAIELCELIAEGMQEGHLEFDFEDEET